MKLDQELADIRSRLEMSLPQCSLHPDKLAGIFCARCGQPVCQSCLTITPVEPRCAKCRDIVDSLPTRGAWLAGFMRGLLRQRWALGFAAATAAFLVLLLFLPGLLRARPPEPAIQGIIGGEPLQAPYIEKSFRLRSLGNLYLAASRTDRAQDCYRRALAACRTHLEGEKRPHVRLQVKLAVARLEDKTGDPDGAIATCREVISEAAGGQAAGVAHFYLAATYEFALKDSARALENYRAALTFAESASADPFSGIEKMLEYDDNKSAGGRPVYGIAGLTDTHVSASAIRGEVTEAIRRLSGKKPDDTQDKPTPETPDGEDQPPEGPEDDPLVIIRGK